MSSMCIMYAYKFKFIQSAPTSFYIFEFSFQTEITYFICDLRFNPNWCPIEICLAENTHTNTHCKIISAKLQKQHPAFEILSVYTQETRHTAHVIEQRKNWIILVEWELKTRNLFLFARSARILMKHQINFLWFYQILIYSECDFLVLRSISVAVVKSTR